MALDTMDSTGRRATEACPLFPLCTMDAYKIWNSNLNPHGHQLWKQENCSSLAPPRGNFYKTQRAW
jgi:hypothetical protein